MRSVGIFARECPYPDPQPPKIGGKMHHSLEADTPITQGLLNNFLNRIIRQEKKNVVVTAKLKKSSTTTGRTAGGPNKRGDHQHLLPLHLKLSQPPHPSQLNPERPRLEGLDIQKIQRRWGGRTKQCPQPL